uniref:Glycerol-3-phosphate acyltransferase 2, mitochondrial n=1 Tax=Calidris pygmaea TaxID=425635 RepID=A0A8C3JQZ7_9CHAR
MKNWICDSGQKLEVFIPFLGKHRPFLGRCCQTCTPKSWVRVWGPRVLPEGTGPIQRGWGLEWGECSQNLPPLIPRLSTPSTLSFQDGFYHKHLSSLGRLGWPGSGLWGSLGAAPVPVGWLTCLFPCRLCNWALLKLLNRLFLSVQLHRGQLAMVLRAARTPNVPLVFLSTHKSPLDGLLLSFLLFSQGLGVPRVTVGSQVCTLLARLGGIFLPSRMEDETFPELQKHLMKVFRAELCGHVEVLRSRQPLLIFLEEPLVALHLSPPARQWLAMVYRAVRDGAVPDVLLVPVGIAYDMRGTQPLGLGTCLRAACQALRRSHGCARVDFAQPFSLQVWQRGWWPWLLRLEELLLPTILGMGTSPLLADSVACSAVMAVGITAALLLHKHQEGVFLSQLMRDFAWLLEEILLRQRDVGFSGQLRALVQHSLALLQAHLTLYHLAPIGDILVVPEASVVALWELGHHSAAILPTFASEAVGACAIHALLMEMLPFLGVTVGPSGIVLSQDELLRKILELLWLLPPNLLGLQVGVGGAGWHCHHVEVACHHCLPGCGEPSAFPPLPQPCQPLDCLSQDILDKLLLCGLLEAEEVGASPLPPKPPPGAGGQVAQPSLRVLARKGTRGRDHCWADGWDTGGMASKVMWYPPCPPAAGERALGLRLGPAPLLQPAALGRDGLHRQ